jgi:hypothetical protein
MNPVFKRVGAVWLEQGSGTVEGRAGSGSHRTNDVFVSPEGVLERSDYQIGSPKQFTDEPHIDHPHLAFPAFVYGSESSPGKIQAGIIPDLRRDAVTSACCSGRQFCERGDEAALVWCCVD